MKDDPRLTPANARVAHVSMAGRVGGSLRMVQGDRARVTTALCDLTRRPGGPRDRQLLFGERVLVLERHAGHAFVQAARDGYVGYAPEGAFGDGADATHWLAQRHSHLYPAPDFKTAEQGSLSFGSQVTVVAQTDRFAELDSGAFVPRAHLRALDDPATDPVAMAEMFLGTPYLWGGNGGAGIDCSGLVQAALLACGRACPRDSDQQQAMPGMDLSPDTPLMRGDLVFWAGHVGMMRDGVTVIHANAHHMATVAEPLITAQARILKNEFGPIVARRRFA